MSRQMDDGGQESGCTPVELVLGLAIGALSTGVVVVSLWQFNRITHLHQESLGISHEMQQAASMLNRDVVSAAVLTPTGSITATNGLTLELEVRTVEFGQPATDTFDLHFITYTYSADDHELVRTDSNGSYVIAEQVTDLAFEHVTSTSTLWVTMTVAGREQSQTTTIELLQRPSTNLEE